MKRALVTGITGQDGSYLAELLLKKGYEVIGMVRRSSSEMFGKAVEVAQNERTPFYPRSPYGVAKTYAHWVAVNYRESHHLFAGSGILFNHESPRRGRAAPRRLQQGKSTSRVGAESPLPKTDRDDGEG